MEVATASLFCTFFESLDAPTIFRTLAHEILYWPCLEMLGRGRLQGISTLSAVCDA